MKNKDLKALLLALGISASSMLLTGCNEKENSVLFNLILDDVKDSTCTDEILNLDENKEVLTDFYILDRYLTLSEKLHSLELEEVVTKDKLNPNLEVLSIDDIEKLISKIECESPEEDQYKSDAELLLVNEGFVNEMIYKYGNSTTLKMASLVSKAKIVDALGLDFNEYKNVSILENIEDYNRMHRVKIKYLNESGNSLYYKLELTPSFEIFVEENYISKCIHIVDINRTTEKKEPTKNKYNLVEYNSSINDELYEKCETIKQALCCDYEVENDKIVQLNDNKETRNIYKEKVKSLK